MITTGDLAQEPAITSYQYFARGIAKLLRTPCVWLPGNQDNQKIMADVLFDEGITATKQVTIGDNWKILLLDSKVSEQPYGHLSNHQLL
ncbi:MAG: 3',5'-cyclic-AMP phosphodiesterase, partial [Candidatus Regiella insecticola]|nr:3',5'-cyclic-AMP phosphodiesterase [Candidatus Regiella insecticola]